MKAIGFIGDSGAGKTTLIERLIGHFSRGGLRLAAIKHAHHGFDIDRPGKDSYRFRAAGAAQVLIASGQRWALLSDEAAPESPPASALARLLARLDPCDLVLVEVYRGQAGIPFIEVRRQPEPAMPASADGGTSAAAAAGVIAIATNAAPAGPCVQSLLPMLDLNDIDAIARFIATTLGEPWC